MRQRINEVTNQIRAWPPNFAILPAYWINPPRPRAEQPRDFIGIEPGGVDHATGFEDLALGIFLITNSQANLNQVSCWLQRFHFRVIHKIRAFLLGYARKGVDQFFRGTNTGGGYFQRRETAHMRFPRPNFVGIENPQTIDTVFLSFFL